MKLLKKIGCIGLSIAMLCSVTPLSFAEAGTGVESIELSPTSINVTVDGTTDQTVDVNLISNNGTLKYYAVQGNFSKKETEDSSAKISLTQFTGVGLSFTGTNEAATSTGQILWSDDTFSSPYQPDAGDALVTATYTVAKDAPTGSYTISYTNAAMQIGSESFSEPKVYTATINVTNTLCNHTNKEEHPATDATCTTAGNSAYWSCTDCGKYFSDEGCTTEIAENSWVGAVAALGHNYVEYVDGTSEGYEVTPSNPKVGTGYCTRCGAEQPGYELYWAITGISAGETSKVKANAEVTADIMVKTSQEASLTGVDAELTYGSNLTLKNISNAAADITINTETTGKILIDDGQMTAKNLTGSANDGYTYKLGTVTFETPNEFTASNSTLGITDGAKITVQGISKQQEAKTESSVAGFEPKMVTVSLMEGKNGNGSNACTLVENGSEYTVNGIEGATMELDTPYTMSGRTFVGWSDTESGNALDVQPTVYPEGNSEGKATYYAVYDKNTVVVSVYYYGLANNTPFTYEGLASDTFDSSSINTTAKSAKAGYDFESWTVNQGNDTLADLPTTFPDVSTSYYANYTPANYTIQYSNEGGTAVDDLSYTIETTDKLPTPEKTGYTFLNWKVTTADGNWTENATFAADTAVTGKYGNVTLTAQWQQSVTFEFEEYAYAKTGDVLLVISGINAPDEGNGYTFDNRTMYKITNNDGYDADGVVYVALVTYADYASMTQAQLVAKIGQTSTENPEVNNRGDVNGEATGDASYDLGDVATVYQLLQKKSAWDSSDLTELGRLRADMSTSVTNANARGSLADVEAIVSAKNEN